MGGRARGAVRVTETRRRHLLAESSLDALLIVTHDRALLDALGPVTRWRFARVAGSRAEVQTALEPIMGGYQGSPGASEWPEPLRG